MNSYDTRLSQLVKQNAALRVETHKETMAAGMMDERTYRFTAGRIAGLRDIADLFDEAVKEIEGGKDKN